MSTSSIKEKSKQLGVNFSTASNQLRKLMMFRLVQKCGEAVCFRCGRTIDDPADLSLDHKKDWLHSEQVQELFWDLDNIAFSHKRCNILASLDKRYKSRNITELKNRNKKFQVRKWDNEEQKQKLIGYYATLEEAQEALENQPD